MKTTLYQELKAIKTNLLNTVCLDHEEFGAAVFAVRIECDALTEYDINEKDSFAMLASYAIIAAKSSTVARFAPGLSQRANAVLLRAKEVK